MDFEGLLSGIASIYGFTLHSSNVDIGPMIRRFSFRKKLKLPGCFKGQIGDYFYHYKFIAIKNYRMRLVLSDNRYNDVDLCVVGSLGKLQSFFSDSEFIVAGMRDLAPEPVVFRDFE